MIGGVKKKEEGGMQGGRRTSGREAGQPLSQIHTGYEVAVVRSELPLQGGYLRERVGLLLAFQFYDLCRGAIDELLV